MNLKRITLLYVIIFVVTTPLLGQNVDYSGTSTSNFLKIGVGARAVAMGEAYVTMAEDAGSMFWNAGAIAALDQGSVTFSLINWLVDTKITYLAIVYPFRFGAVGLDIDYFSSGDMEMTTLYEQDGTGRYFSANDLQVGVAYARSMTDRFSVGVKIKYIREELANVSASAFAFDIGSVFTTSFFNNMKIGMTLSNFGNKMQFNGRDLNVIYSVPDSPSNKEVPALLKTEQWEIPLFFRFGASTDLIRRQNFNFLVCYNVLDSRDFKVRHNLGAELRVLNALSLRGGYKFNYSESSYTMGLGLNFSFLGANNLRLDYSYADYGRFSDVQQFSMGVQF